MQADDAQSAIRSLAGDLTQRWLQADEIPDDPVEGTVPAYHWIEFVKNADA